MNADKVLLKDQLFNESKIRYLGYLIKNTYANFTIETFEESVLNELPKLELKERICWIREKLRENLPNDYAVSLEILLRSLPKNLKENDFIFAPFSDFVAEYGCNKRYLNMSLSALGEFTKYFSAEFAIRSFINSFPEETFSQMEDWSKSKNHHQRRLASEGLRPRLPWGKSITFPYKRGASLLDNLYYDSERYVTRSVANHLNDISKIDPDFVLKTLDKWKKSCKQNDKELNYIINHALRTLIKKGHEETFDFLGYKSHPILIKNFKINKKEIKLGESLEFSFKIIGERNAPLVIDYKITYPTPNRKGSQKVFKLKKVQISEGEKMHIFKSHLFKQMTTKKLYSGVYKLELQINGKIIADQNFHLNV